MFLDEVSDNVLTGREIKATGGNQMRLAILDEVTGQVVRSGPGSSAKVEILFLEASENDNEEKWSHQEFSSRIIKQNDKTKPHFAKNYYVYIENGMGVLSNAKLANDSNWTKNCKCRLGAQVVENSSGTKVQEAWTEPFMVSDSRGKLYGKRYPPSLSDEVWRLNCIARGGKPCKRLKKNRISTLQDFLFLRSVDPHKLKEIIGVRAAAWREIEDHVRTCNIDDSRTCVYYDPSELDRGVVFDIIGRLKGIIRDYQYVQDDHLSKFDKDHAKELLRSAFEYQDRIIFYTDEMTLVRQFQYRANNTATNDSIQENIVHHSESTEPGASSQGTSRSIRPSGNATLTYQIPNPNHPTSTRESTVDCDFTVDDVEMADALILTSPCPSPSLRLDGDDLPNLVVSNERPHPVAPKAARKDVPKAEEAPKACPVPLHLGYRPCSYYGYRPSMRWDYDYSSASCPERMWDSPHRALPSGENQGTVIRDLVTVGPLIVIFVAAWWMKYW